MGKYRSGVSSIWLVGHTPTVSRATGRHPLQKRWPHMVATISPLLCTIWKKENHNMCWEKELEFADPLAPDKWGFSASEIRTARNPQICQSHFTKKWLVELHSKGWASSQLPTASHISQLICAAPHLWLPPPPTMQKGSQQDPNIWVKIHANWTSNNNSLKSTRGNRVRKNMQLLLSPHFKSYWVMQSDKNHTTALTSHDTFPLKNPAVFNSVCCIFYGLGTFLPKANDCPGFTRRNV